MNTQTIDLGTLNAQQLAELEAQIEARKQAEKKRKDDEIKTYKGLVKKTVVEQIKELQKVSSLLSKSKADLFNNFIAILQMKAELYGIKATQQSHTFSDDLGNSIKLGYRIIDRYDDTLDEGIAFIHTYIDSLAVDENSAKVVKKLYRLLKKDANGNLKPNRVIELQNLADEENDENLSKGVEIIKKSYKPVRSAIFVEAETTDNTGKKRSVALSITTADFPEGSNLDFDLFDNILKKHDQIHLCESCQRLEDFPECLPDGNDVKFGKGNGNDNIIECKDYQPITKN